jgi:hypothetical protein
MEYEHIPWGVVLDENATIETLKQFPVLLLPNVAIVSEKEVALFRRYLEEGGKLIVTGLSGMRGWRGETHSQSGLMDLIGAKVVRELDSTDNWVRFPATDFSNDASKLVLNGPRNWPFLVRGPAVVYEPTSATAIGELLQPHRTSLHADHRYNKDWPLSADAPVGPAILINKIGKGAVLTFATSPDWATASDHHIVETRQLLVNAVFYLNPKPRLRIEAPATVQTVVTDDPARRTLRVHLLGYNAPPQTTPAKDRPYVLPVPIEDAPMYRATVTLRDDLKSARTFSRITELKKRGNRVELTIEDIHEVVTLRY